MAVLPSSTVPDMRAIGTFAGLFAPVLVAVGLAVVIGQEQGAGAFLVIEGFLFALMYGVTVWARNRRRGSAIAAVSAQLRKASSLLGELMPKEASGKEANLRPRVEAWIEETRGVIGRKAPDLLPEYDAPLSSRLVAIDSPSPNLRDLEAALRLRIALLNDFLVHLRIAQ